MFQADVLWCCQISHTSSTTATNANDKSETTTHTRLAFQSWRVDLSYSNNLEKRVSTNIGSERVTVLLLFNLHWRHDERKYYNSLKQFIHSNKDTRRLSSVNSWVIIMTMASLHTRTLVEYLHLADLCAKCILPSTCLSFACHFAQVCRV